MTETDESWRDLFQHRASTVEVPESRVAAVLSTAGTRVRRRRRLRSAAPVVAVAATVFAVTAATGVSQVLARSGPGDSPAASPASPSVRPAPESTVVERLERLLSATGRVSNVSRRTSRTGGTLASLSYDDGGGPAVLTVTVERVPAGTARDWSCAESTCTVRTRPDGAVVMTDRRTSAESGYRQWSAKLGRPDGVVITLVESNSDRPKGAVSREQPPHSAAELADLLLALNW